MCGIAGFANIQDRVTRWRLACSLGVGIDFRGGDAIGYAIIKGDTIEAGRKLGTWLQAPDSFVGSVAASPIAMLHARYATCGNKKDPMQAHPFRIDRNGKPRLWGMHNGVIYDAEHSAKFHKRPYTVDSRELFELLADDAIGVINDLEGYGVIQWIEAGTRHIKIAKLTDDGAIVIARTAGNGLVWASTLKILRDALEHAELKIEHTFKLDEVGRVYQINGEGQIVTSPQCGIKVASCWEMLEPDSEPEPEGCWTEEDEAQWKRNMMSDDPPYSEVERYLRMGAWDT